MTDARAKTGGRKAGTPNRKTQEAAELLSAMDCNPIEGMARIAMNPKASLELRGRMFAELAGFVYPKRKAVELATDQGDPLTVIVEYVDKQP